MNWNRCRNVGGYFHRNGYSLSKRNSLFYSICIPIRILLGITLWFLLEKFHYIKELKLTIAILIIFAEIYVITNTFTCRNDRTIWWSREFESLIMTGMFIFAILILCNKIPPEQMKYIAIFIWIDAFIGLLLNFYMNNYF
jgi:hypothetical protein